VFRARELSSGRDCALKVLKEEYSETRDVIERFQREVFAIASISSPHVVTMLDFGIADVEREFFMVMEFVQGPSLRELLGAHEPWAPEDVLVVVGQVAHALMAAHKREIIHRDLKPENVMLVERGGSFVAKVLDFGFAKLAELERTLELRPITRVGFCFGTPQYLSPEQIRGRPIDGGADLFALGVIAYEMLTGELPFGRGSLADVVLAQARGVRPLTMIDPRIASGLDRAVMRALQMSPAARPVSAHEFAAALLQASGALA
jgi:serine/threonine-protein kinase